VAGAGVNDTPAAGAIPSPTRPHRRLGTVGRVPVTSAVHKAVGGGVGDAQPSDDRLPIFGSIGEELRHRPQAAELIAPLVREDGPVHERWRSPKFPVLLTEMPQVALPVVPSV
jgi:hypothetical protein